jgi:hypothetical protein
MCLLLFFKIDLFLQYTHNDRLVQHCRVQLRASIGGNLADTKLLCLFLGVNLGLPLFVRLENVYDDRRIDINDPTPTSSFLIGPTGPRGVTFKQYLVLFLSVGFAIFVAFFNL